ncbi:unnamed protein product [Toxocara canis]|uniref:Methylenetetrahydrofolate reductase (NAD(P)H) n=1 Tax=Toxocara canis TaxID=6265 RepID=A0A183UZ48_TOXCA|nr:unnamed protein product [Toxocara canis]
MERDTSSDAEEQRRRRSAAFVGIAESCDLPHLRHVRDVESVAEILDELNVDGVPIKVCRMGVFNPTKHCPTKACLNQNGIYTFRVRLRHSFTSAVYGNWLTAQLVKTICSILFSQMI